MTDRKPGAPGQFKAVITAVELQKLQNGEQFTITLNRDDQPITEGTPYSKAAVLPDELAALICPDVIDPAPADALAGLLPRNGGAAMTGALPMGGNKITGVGTPEEDEDAATKKYVDEGLGEKAASSHNHAASAITSGTIAAARLPTTAINKGGTGATTAANARTNLGLESLVSYTLPATSGTVLDALKNNFSSFATGTSFLCHITAGSYGFSGWGIKLGSNWGMILVIGTGPTLNYYYNENGTWGTHTVSRS